MTRAILLASVVLTPITTCSIRGYTCSELTSEGEVTEWRRRRATATVRFSSGA
jgi:hypothetical protein